MRQVLRDYAGTVSRRYEHRLVDSMRWTEPQQSMLSSREAIALFWGANQIGKTYVIAADIALFLMGLHPFDQTHKPPVKVIFAGHSWAEMAGTIEKLWAFLDKRHFLGKLRFEGGQLKGQKLAIYDIIGGAGKGSQLILATYEQGAKRIAGPTIHRLATDEPPPAKFYGEAVPRLLRHGGHMRIGFTPTLDTYSDLDWLWKLVDDGVIEEHRAELCLRSVTPLGGLLEIPWLNREKIERFESSCLPAEVEMRMGRSRHAVAGCRVIGRFSELNLSEEMPEGDVGIGIDHSKAPGREVAVIVVVGSERGRPVVWVVDAVHSEPHGTPEEFAQAIIRSLRLNLDISIANVDYWIGDRAAVSSTTTWSNDELLAAFGAVVGGTLPAPLEAMDTPYKYSGSAIDGWKHINQLCAKEQMRIHPRCTSLIKSLRMWEGDPKSALKDVLDALRYPVVEMVPNEYTKDRPTVRFR